MLKLDRDQLRMVVALFAVAAIAAILLGLTDMVTREPIAAAQKAALHAALKQVLPAHRNDPQADVVYIPRAASHGADDAVAIFPARDAQGALVGLAWEVVAPDGYSGSIRILVGVKPDGAIHAIRVTAHKETPGLGDGIVKNHGWLRAFAGKTLANAHWKVKKDGGDFDQFTGATITPRAVIKAVHGALDFFATKRAAIMAALQPKTKAEGAHGGVHG